MEKKQTAVQQLGIEFRQWIKDWDYFAKTGKNKPISYDEFMKPFLEMEKEQIICAYDSGLYYPTFCEKIKAEQYYNETYKSK